jgi:hypothetical protein
MFSSKRCRFVVPGIGTIQGFWARSQASAIWAGVAFLRSAMLPSRSTSARFAFRASGVKRGTVLRKSVLSKVVFSSILPVRKPRPSGLKGTKPIPSLAAEIGAHYQLKGDRAKAEERFKRSFSAEGGNRYNTLRAAGS